MFLVYFMLTTTIFLIALSNGNEGVSIRIFGGGDDGYFYWEQAKNIAAGRDAILTSIYPLIIGYIVKITGIESVYIIRLFNFFGFVLLVLFSIYLIKLFSKLEDKKFGLHWVYDAKIVLLIIFLLYPSLQIQVNLSIYRDVWIYLIYLLSTILSMKIIFIGSNRVLNFLLLLLTLWLLGEFRTYSLLSFLLTVAFYFFYKWTKKLKKPSFIPILLILLFGIYYKFFMDYQVPIVNMSLKQVLNYRNYFLTIAPGGSQMEINLDQPSFTLFIINYIHSYVGNLLGPLPWHIRNTSTLFAFFTETIPMLLILIFLWNKRGIITKVQEYVLLHAFIWIGLIAVSNDNIGAATRLRAVGWILILIVFASVFSKSRCIKKKRCIDQNLILEKKEGLLG
ncbi:MAG: hypothetical protein L5655_10540 [Thermosediminibacteraceae bacterium]|nr:hypothetical protein [Thermosediminibacteraceae bacterium]